MSYYLQMDGVDDTLRIPHSSALNTINKIEIKFRLVDSRNKVSAILTKREFAISGHFFIFVNGTVLNVDFNAQRWNNITNISIGSWTTLSLDVVPSADSTLIVNDNTFTNNGLRTPINNNGDLYILGDRGDALANLMKGDIEYLKLYTPDGLFTHLDMSTGTVQDQSGNGKHATLVGGTWIQDTPTNPDPIAIQSDFSTKQVINKQITEQVNTKQSIFKQTTDNFTAKQTISKQTMDNFNTKQIIRKQITSDFATNQVITATSSYFYDFSTKQIIHKQTAENMKTKQSIFKNALIEVPTKQTIYKATINDSLTKQILFKSVVDDNKANLIIFRRVTSDYPTTQRIIQEGAKEYTQEINLTFYINRSVDLDFKITRKAPLTFKI